VAFFMLFRRLGFYWSLIRNRSTYLVSSVFRGHISRSRLVNSDRQFEVEFKAEHFTKRRKEKLTEAIEALREMADEIGGQILDDNNQWFYLMNHKGKDIFPTQRNPDVGWIDEFGFYISLEIFPDWPSANSKETLDCRWYGEVYAYKYSPEKYRSVSLIRKRERSEMSTDQAIRFFRDAMAALATAGISIVHR
jgi:hypothetical protein